MRPGRRTSRSTSRELSDHDRQRLIDAMTMTEDETEIALKIVRAGLSRLYPSVTLDVSTICRSTQLSW